MSVIGISPSNLELFRRHQVGAPYAPETGDQLEAELMGRVETSEAMSRGTAFHELIEHGTGPYHNPKSNTFVVFEKDLGVNWTFDFNTAAQAEFVRAEFRGMQNEVWNTLEMESGAHVVKMRMRHDALFFNWVLEFKTTGTPKTWLDYYDSVQWRCYLLALPDAELSHYRVFRFNPKNEIVEVYKFDYRREERILETVSGLVDSFVNWAETRPNLWAFLEAKANKK